MAVRSAIESGIRGLVAASRGALEGQVASLQARNEQDRANAEIAWKNRTLDIEEQKLLMDDAFKRAALGEEARQADQADATERFITIQDNKNRLLVVDTQTKRLLEGTQYTADQNLAGVESTNQAKRDVAKTDADASKYTADQKLAGETLRAEADERIAQQDADTRLALGEIQRDIAGAKNLTDYQIALADNATKQMGLRGKAALYGIGTVPEDLRADYAKVLDKMWQSKEFKDLGSLRHGYLIGMRSYLQTQRIEEGDEKAAYVADVGLLNSFQRMVDPGVSVREGDLHILGNVAALDERVARAVQNLAKGGKLSDAERQQFARAMIEMWNEKVRAWNLPSSDRQQLQDMVDNFGMSEWITLPEYQEQLNTIGAITIANDPTLGWEGSVGRGGERMDILGAVGSPERDANIDKFADSAIESGMTAEQLQQNLIGYMEAKGISRDEDFLTRVLQRFAELQKNQENVRPRQGGASLQNKGDGDDDTGKED